MATSQEIIAGSGGFQVVTGTGSTTGQYNSVVVVSDAIFASFSINGTNVLSSKGLSLVTIKAGAFLPAGVDNKITAFQLTSGTVIAYS
jgi:hypothetical protein